MKYVTIVSLAALAVVIMPSVTWACACGCGVFDVGSSEMFPEGEGGMAYLEYDFQDQTQNWSGNSHAPAADNSDKEIRTSFVTVGLQYMFNRSWGAQIDVPYVQREFTTVGGASGDDTVGLDWGQLGDIRIKGIYTGFSEAMSTGVELGFKLPTGSYSHNDAYGDIDRDTEISTGSTDVLLGGFYRGNLTDFAWWKSPEPATTCPATSCNLTSNALWTWFVQAQVDVPTLVQEGYRPGVELDAAVGVVFRGWNIRGVQVSPMLQAIGSVRANDTGPAANPDNSGYERILLSPGLEFHYHRVRLYADVEVPTYEHLNGNQLVAPVLVKVLVSLGF